MDTVLPCVAEGLDLLGFAGDVVGLAVLDVAAGGGPLEIGIKLDAVRRVEVDALDFAFQAFAFGEGGHDEQAVAENHAIGPVLVVLVKFGFVHAGRDAVEVGEEVDAGRVAFARLEGLALEVLDEEFGMDFFLDVEGRGVDEEVRGILPVLATPDELGVEVAVAAFVRGAQGRAFGVGHEVAEFGGGDVFPLLAGVGEAGDGFGIGVFVFRGRAHDGRGLGGSWIRFATYTHVCKLFATVENEKKQRKTIGCTG